MIIVVSILLFCLYMLVRNMMVGAIYLRFIEYFYHGDPDGYRAGNRFRNHVISYEEMMFKFWVWPLSSFYPSYDAHKRGAK